jgi:hypothetical protein
VAKGAKAMGELQLRDALAAAFGDSPFDTSRVAHAAENSGATSGYWLGRYRLKPIERILKRAWRGSTSICGSVRLLGDQADAAHNPAAGPGLRRGYPIHEPVCLV